MTQSTNEYYAVEVPEDAISLRIDGNVVDSVLTALREELTDIYNCNKFWSFCLPPGNWKFLFTTKEMTEDQAAQVVRELLVGGRYENYCAGYPFWFRTAGESLGSLLRSKGLDDKKNYAILKKEP